jgi:primosomal protein N' (replication factor Y)
VFNLPLERSFHYLVPAALQAAARPGVRVRAPFGARELTGMVVRLVESSPICRLKAIRRVIDPEPVIAEERWGLARWLAGYYYCSLGEALAAMVPSELRLPGSEAAGPASTPGEAHSGARVAGPRLTDAQAQALEAMIEALDSSRAQTLLLHGVTGSGKTELYLRAIAHALARGRGAICLVPEIALTAQTTDRFRERFGARVAVWHSAMGSRARAAAWRAISSGAAPVVVGARSAVFAPVRRLGLIVLDEEQETSYKQDKTPRYHAREVALERARLAAATVVLGSATPSVESFFHARRGLMRLLTLPQRVEARALPAAELIDLRQEWRAGRRPAPLSQRLEGALERALAQGEQAMLLLNRRGFARVGQCQACGAVVRCDRCSMPLIYHAQGGPPARPAQAGELRCHYCGRTAPPPDVCRQCRKGYVRFRGAGTERIESELHRLFPQASIGRMDADTMRGRGQHRRLYEAVRQRQIGLLVGTQMIAKGLDFPQVTLVGIVSADTALSLPDFRAGERTFDLLTQMAGRAGRGEQPGRVLIQTHCPSHYAIRAAARHDYAAFYEEEIRMRRRLGLPPWTHLIELTIRTSRRERAHEAAASLAQALRRHARGRRVTLLGPAPHRVERLRRRYQVCVVLKGRSVPVMIELLRRALELGRRFRGLPVTVDVDPL